jgi:hypothetical protein
MSGADLGREAVYAAEIAAFEGTSYESLVTFDELAALAVSISSAAWWPHGQVSVVPARRDARTSSTRQRGEAAPVVRLAAPQMTPATLIHELAHVLAGLAAGHGEVFRRAHVDLAGVAFGATEASWLLDAYDAVGLPAGARAWPDPTPHRRGGPIAL